MRHSLPHESPLIQIFLQLGGGIAAVAIATTTIGEASLQNQRSSISDAPHSSVIFGYAFEEPR